MSSIYFYELVLLAAGISIIIQSSLLGVVVFPLSTHLHPTWRCMPTTQLAVIGDWTEKKQRNKRSKQACLASATCLNSLKT
tara:strand:- start:274 stop:516 length:243 start_codon:yes stop_codon:yes gene_type:complete